MNTDDDQLVEEYLAQLRAEALVLPADRRDELVEEITAHIAEARLAAAAAGSGDQAQVRNILDRLGDPADIVRTAADAPPGSQAWSAGAGFGAAAQAPGWAAASWPPAGRAGRIGGMEIAAVLLLLLGGLIIPVLGWFAGVVLLWISPRWTTRDKLLGTLIWPGGLLAPVLVLFAGVAGALTASSSQVCVSTSAVAPKGAVQAGQAAAAHCTTSGFSLPPWLAITLVVVLMTAAIAGPVWIALRLLRRARQAPAEATAAPANLIPA